MAAVAIPYPPSPTKVPEGLTDFPDSYTNRQTTLFISLIVFLMTYLAMISAAGFGTVMLILMVRTLGIFAIVGAICSSLVFLFLVKGLFKRPEAEKDLHIEITEREHPRLFGFIRKLCDEVGVDEPNRVLVSPDVNAAVIIRTSVVNLFVEPNRDLLIGLGLVNALNLSEFKAAMAHEFGHFSQGGWMSAYFHVVYRVCYEIVVGRDWLDHFVDKTKKVGGLGAVIGYPIGFCLSVMRWGLDKIFGVIAFQRHSVLQEQEFHADLVAASVAGSNAITHCLYRISFAAEAFDRAMADLFLAADHELYTSDIYYHQHPAGDLIRRQKRNPQLGKPPELAHPSDGRKLQLFDPDQETDPRDEGDYHPPNHEREENIKDEFVVAIEDTRTAWVLFSDSGDLRERMTYKMYRRALKIPKNTELANPQTVQKFIDDENAETNYDPRYEGVYDNRLINPGDLDELNETMASEPWDDAQLAEAYRKLYRDVKGKTDARRELMEELNNLFAESDGARSKRIKRLIRELEDDLEQSDKWFHRLDRRAYLIFIQMAFKVSETELNDLLARYRFHMAVQNIFREAREHKRKAHFFFGLALSKEEDLQPEEFAETMAVFRQARRALKQMILDADEINMPAMANFVKGEKLGKFLLDVRIVKEFPERRASVKHVIKLLNQLDKVESRAARLHFKSLGGILAIQERVATAFLSQRQA